MFIFWCGIWTSFGPITSVCLKMMIMLYSPKMAMWIGTMMINSMITHENLRASGHPIGSWSWNLVVTVQDTGTVIQLCNEKAQKAIENCSRCLSKGEVSTGFQGAKLGRYWYILEDIDDNNLQKDGTVRFLTSPHPRKCGDTGSSSNWGYYSIWFIMTGWWFGTWILWLSIQLGMSSSHWRFVYHFSEG